MGNSAVRSFVICIIFNKYCKGYSTKRDQMGGKCSMPEVRYACKILVGKPVGEKS
jgi:hypothetical protein